MALLAVIGDVARTAAANALSGPDGEAAPSLILTAVAVRYHGPAAGPLTAAAVVPCDRSLADRAGADGDVRFSVAVVIAADDGTRVATATVQWRARLTAAATEPPRSPITASETARSPGPG
jgi:hypothetical protein